MIAITPIRTIASAGIVAPSLSKMILALVEVELSKSYLTFVILAVEGIMTSTDGRAGKLIFKSNVMSLPAGISRPIAKVVVYARQYFPSFKLLLYSSLPQMPLRIW